MIEARFQDEVEKIVVLVEAEADKASMDMLEPVQATA